MTENNYIIGGGLAGLITAFYNPQYTIIDPLPTKSLGKFQRGPEIIWNTVETRQLLNDLNININIKTIKVGFIGELNCILDECTDMMKACYYGKSRCFNIPVLPSERSLSEQKTSIEVIDMSFKTLIEELSRNLIMLPSSVTRINLMTREICLDSNDWRRFKTLISTIPAPIFSELVNGKKLQMQSYTYRWSSKIFSLITNLYDNEIIDDISYDNNYDIIYDCRFNSPFSRFTKIDNNTYVAEFNVDKNKFIEIVDNITSRNIEKNYHFQHYGQITSDRNISDIIDEGLYFVGRFAKWKHGIKLQDIIANARYLGGQN